ncbi:MAG: hypothetical protein M3327_05455 [Actinomycetota bacterium]|nr:hypothetical protein [Actinomycetota bacterium]
MRVRFCDEFESGIGWLEEGSRLERCAHVLVVDGRVWIIDPFDADGVEQKIRALGEPAGVIQLLDRHERDGAAFAERFGVALHRAPAGDAPTAPFELIPVVGVPGWRELALWWPQAHTLVCADVLGTTGYFLAPGEVLAVHPLRRLTPPRRLVGLPAAHVLVGHGEGIHGGDAASSLDEAIRTARRRIPRWLAGLSKAKEK